MNKKEFDKVCNALLLEVDKSIVDSIRKVGHEYAEQVSRERAVDFGRWKQQSRYELIPSDYTEFMEWKSNQEDNNG